MTAVTEPSVQTKKKPGRPRKAQPNNHKALSNLASTVYATETPDQRRARLLAELAELDGAAGQPKGKSNLPLGPNYWTMGHSTLKTLCISNEIVDRTGTREGMIQQLQARDAVKGMQPHPKENEQAQAGIRAGTTPVHAETHTRDATRIIDADGNELALVYRVGRNINGQPVLNDFENNIRKVVAALNEGRL